jgi:hypothetical protein
MAKISGSITGRATVQASAVIPDTGGHEWDCLLYIIDMRRAAARHEIRWQHRCF